MRTFLTIAHLDIFPLAALRVAELTALLEKEMQQSGETSTLKVASLKPAGWTPPAKGSKAGRKEKLNP